MDTVQTVDRKALANFLNGDGSLRIVEWGRPVGMTSGKLPGYRASQLVSIDLSQRSAKMAHSHATGEGLVTNGLLGVDVIRLAAGDGFAPHTHPGDHLLIVVGGIGTITFDGKIYETQAGQVYMVEGSVPHAVGAVTDHVILAVGSPHKPVDSLERMTPVEYQAVTAALGDLHCLICDIKAPAGRTLLEMGCPHCPSQFYVEE